MLHDLVDCMYVLCYMIWLIVCMCYVAIFGLLYVCAMLHDLVDCMYVLCCMIWLTVCAVLHDLVNCKCYVA